MASSWDATADLRCQQIEGGLDLTFSRVFVPWYQRFVEAHRCRTLLEVGAGTGHLARSLCDLVNYLTALEPSDGMFEQAQAVLATSHVVLRKLHIEELEPDRYYDAVISHLCIQAVSDPGMFLRAMGLHVAPQGTLVVSVPHPCFYNEYKSLIPSADYQYMRDIFKQISFAISLDPSRSISDVPYYHRPLVTYVRAIADAGFLLEDLDEIFPAEDIQRLYGQHWTTPRYVVFVARRRPQ